MARISTYGIDSSITGTELLLGTNPESSPVNKTVNYTVDAVVEYMSGFKVATVEIDAARAKTLWSDPLVLVESPGSSSKILVPYNLIMILSSGLAFNYSNSQIKVGHYNVNTSTWLQTWFTHLSGLTSAENSVFQYATTGCQAPISYDSTVSNLPLVVASVAAADATDGAKTCKFIMQYKEFSLLS